MWLAFVIRCSFASLIVRFFFRVRRVHSIKWSGALLLLFLLLSSSFSLLSLFASHKLRIGMQEQTNERGSVNYRHDPYKAALGEGGGEESDEEDSDFEVGSESSSSSEDEGERGSLMQTTIVSVPVRAAFV